jgi:cytochrome c-type biogenesis protein CcmH/NrfF
MAARTKQGAVAGALLVLLLALAWPAGAQQTERAKRLGKQLMCMCGCNQVLTECNHIDCSVRAHMLDELDERVKSNESDDLILQSFIQEYGERVLVVPPAKGFDLAAWILPVVVPLVGLGLVALVVLRWRHQAALAPAEKVSGDLLARARREAEREGEE